MPLCANCGNEVAAELGECPECGCPRQPERAARGARERRFVSPRMSGGGAPTTDAFAFASIAFAVLGVLFLYVVGPILGIVFGNVARARIRRTPGMGGDQLARAGVTLGWVGLILEVVVFAIVLFALRNGAQGT
jgi:hypothetical protein